MAQIGRDEIVEKIETYIVENPDGLITATQMNEILTDIADSYRNHVVDSADDLTTILESGNHTNGNDIHISYGDHIRFDGYANLFHSLDFDMTVFGQMHPITGPEKGLFIGANFTFLFHEADFGGAMGAVELNPGQSQIGSNSLDYLDSAFIVCDTNVNKSVRINSQSSLFESFSEVGQYQQSQFVEDYATGNVFFAAATPELETRTVNHGDFYAQLVLDPSLITDWGTGIFTSDNASTYNCGIGVAADKSFLFSQGENSEMVFNISSDKGGFYRNEYISFEKNSGIAIDGGGNPSMSFNTEFFANHHSVRENYLESNVKYFDEVFPIVWDNRFEMYHGKSLQKISINETSAFTEIEQTVDGYYLHIHDDSAMSDVVFGITLADGFFFGGNISWNTNSIFVDNTAALIAGLNAGQMYYTPDGEVRIVVV